MRKAFQRAFSLLLVLALAATLTVPALAAPGPDVSLNMDRVTLVPGETATLLPRFTPADAANQAVTWSTNAPSVATVKNGVVTAVAVGVATITVTARDGGSSAICKVTVEENYATGVTITPAGPETLPIGQTRQLKAAVVYAHEPDGSQAVTWASSNTAVATVSGQGLVTALSEGQAEIMAISAQGREGSNVVSTYALTVNSSQVGADSDDSLFLTQTQAKLYGGLGQSVILTAPGVSVLRNGADVTGEYTLTWTWTDAASAVVSREQTASVALPSQDPVTVVCAVSAASRTDSSKEPLTGRCVYTVTVLPGTMVRASTALADGAAALGSLTDPDTGLNVVDQLTRGSGEAAPAIPGLKEVTFLPDAASGDAGALNVAEDQAYSLAADADQKLAEVVFTPIAAGTCVIPFLAHGDQDYYGQLTVTVTAPTVPDVPVSPDPPVTGEADMACDSAGLTFSGSDFYRSEDSDPVAAVTFGKPTAGLLLRDLAFGSGTPEDGAWYYTDSARDGDYHVSTLSYLPPAGFSGKVSLPMGILSKSGQRGDGFLVVDVKHKTASDTFTDVTADDFGPWAADSVDFASHFGLVNGVGENAFGPSGTMTRAMLVTVLYRAAGSPDVTVTTNFEDLNANSYYYNAVVWANALGVVDGTSPTTFDPDAPVTRQQIAVILYRYAALNGRADSGQNVSLDAYTDKDQVAPYAFQGISWAVGRHIITGTAPSVLSPDALANRAQVVVMLHRFLTA